MKKEDTEVHLPQPQVENSTENNPFRNDTHNQNEKTISNNNS